MIEENEVPWHYVDAFEGHPLPALADLSGLVILGGEMNVDEIERFPHLLDTRRLVIEAIDSNMPTLGICLGAQVLARALDAPVYKAPAKEIGFVEVAATDAGALDPVSSAFAPRSRVFQFHEDAIELPEGAELLIEGTANRVQAFRIGNAYGVQFHFEVTETEIENWSEGTPDLETSWGVTKDDLLLQAKEHLATQHDLGREAMEGFLGLLA